MNKGNELVLLGTLKITMINFLANFIYSDAISSFNASFFNGSHSRTFLVASRSSLSQDGPLNVGRNMNMRKELFHTHTY